MYSDIATAPQEASMPATIRTAEGRLATSVVRGRTQPSANEALPFPDLSVCLQFCGAGQRFAVVSTFDQAG
jgi:hypothetical protein